MFCAYYSMQAFGQAVAIGFLVLLVIYFTIMIIDFVAIEGFDVQLAPDWFPVRRSESESLAMKCVALLVLYLLVGVVAYHELVLV